MGEKDEAWAVNIAFVFICSMHVFKFIKRASDPLAVYHDHILQKAFELVDVVRSACLHSGMCRSCVVSLCVSLWRLWRRGCVCVCGYVVVFKGRQCDNLPAWPICGAT